jgi:DNA primase
MHKTKKPFVDFRAIRAQVTMEQVLDHYGVLDTFKRNGNRLSGPCPIHGGSNPTQFRVDTDKNLWNCFSECKNGGNVLDFIARKEEVSIHDAAIKACEWFGISLDQIKPDGAQREPDKSPERSAEAATSRPPKPTSRPTSANEDATPNPPLKFRLEKLDRSHPYLTDRGLTQETIIDFGIGFFTGEKGLMTGHVVIPIHNVKGEVVAYAGRWPGQPPNGTPKYKLPPGFRKALELFNIDRAVKEPPDKPLVIVEGFFDAIKLHQHGCRRVVALMGSTMSKAQEELIRKHTNATSLVLVMLDEDDAGRAGREDIARRLSQFSYVKAHQFNEPGTQPDHLSAEQVQQLMGGAS